MRLPRLKASAHPGFYHCTSRVIAGQFLVQTTGPGSLAAGHCMPLMHKSAAFYGVSILTIKPSPGSAKTGSRTLLELSK